MDLVPRDLRVAVRALSRKPGVTALAVVSLALAIGFSTAAFSVLDAWSLRDLPVGAPRELAWIYASTREHRPDNFTWLEYQALAARSRLVSTIVAQGRERYRVRLPDRDDMPILSSVSDNYFDGLGMKAARGDVFHAGKGEDATVVLSSRYWKQALGGDPAVIGRSLEVRRAPLRIIGVLPPGFTGGARGVAVDLFVAPQTFFGVLHGANPNDTDYREFELIGRLMPGVSHERVRAELDPILRQVERDGLAPGPDRTSGIEAFAEKGLRSKIEGNAILLATIVLLILIAAANLANLRLVDNESHRRETGVRLALGAGRAVLVRHHLTETLLLGLTGAAGGLLLARWLIGMAEALLYAGKDYMDYGIVLDRRSLAFSSAALLTVALIGGLIPWSDAWKRRISPVLQGMRVTGSSRWLGVLVVTQMALVTGVTCSAGLLWRSLENIAAIRPAMDPDRKMLLVRGSWAGVPDKAASVRAAALAAQMATVPGVERVAWARRALLSGSGGGAVVSVEMPGHPKLAFRYNQVSPNYFAATGARVLSGRPFAESDGPDNTPVTMVNAEFAKRFLGGGQVLGAWARIGGKDRQIVGVVEDGPTIHLRETVEPYLYFPFAQMPLNGPTFFVETRTAPGGLAGSVRSLLRSSDKTFGISDMMSLGEHMRGARSGEQLAAEVTGGLAGVGLLLAAAGLFGVSLYAVTRRTPEFGVRMAMGATPWRLAREVLQEAGLRVALAIPLGWAMAYAARHALEKMLYGVAADDPRIFVGASLLVTAVGCAAALHPALRASRIDPMAALRSE